MSFKDISYLELWWRFVQRSRAILVECIMRNNTMNLFPFGQWFRKRCRLKDLLSGALGALVFSGAEPFMQFWKRASWGTFIWSYMKFGPVVQEEMLFKEKVYARRTKSDQNTSPWAWGSGELIKGNEAHNIQTSKLTLRIPSTPGVGSCFLIWFFMLYQQSFSFAWVEWTSTKLELIGLAQGHDAVTPARLGLESSTEQLRSLGVGSKVKTIFFLEVIMLHIN